MLELQNFGKWLTRCDSSEESAFCVNCDKVQPHRISDNEPKDDLLKLTCKVCSTNRLVADKRKKGTEL